MDTGLYVHIPFCERKCKYCGFYSVIAESKYKRHYIDALAAEARYRSIGKHFDTVFIGGGTPSCLPDGELTRLFSILKIDTDTLREFTVEANPNSLTDNKIDEYRRLGVTRLSIGAQSLNDKSLSAIGRTHTAKQIVEALNKAIQSGFDVNVDYMLGLPLQTIDDIERDLLTICNNGVGHVSCYSLILEDETLLYEEVKSSKTVLPDEDATVDMYDAAKYILENHGLKRYEISNFGKPCLHNLTYWQLNNYVGLGAAAHSFIDGVHSHNQDNIDAYERYYYISDNARLIDTTAHNTHIHAALIEQSNAYDIVQEYIMLGLRLDKGIDLISMSARFGCDIVTQLIKACSLYSQRLIMTDEFIAVNPRYTYVSGGITTDILIELDKIYNY